MPTSDLRDGALDVGRQLRATQRRSNAPDRVLCRAGPVQLTMTDRRRDGPSPTQLCHALPMDRSQGDPPLLSGRGFLLIEDFCLNTGLDRPTVEDLMRTQLFEGALWGTRDTTRPIGILEDALPSRQMLAAMGLPVRDDYDPDDLRYGELPASRHVGSTDDEPRDA
jgi:hypothetical protein